MTIYLVCTWRCCHSLPPLAVHRFHVAATGSMFCDYAQASTTPGPAADAVLDNATQPRQVMERTVFSHGVHSLMLITCEIMYFIITVSAVGFFLFVAAQRSLVIILLASGSGANRRPAQIGI